MEKGLLFVTDGKESISFFRRADASENLKLIKQIAKHEDIHNLHQDKVHDLHDINYIGYAVIVQDILNQQKSEFYGGFPSPYILPQTHINLKNFEEYIYGGDFNIFLDISIEHKGIWKVQYNYGTVMKGFKPKIFEEEIKLED